MVTSCWPVQKKVESEKDLSGTLMASITGDVCHAEDLGF